MSTEQPQTEIRELRDALARQDLETRTLADHLFRGGAVRLSDGDFVIVSRERFDAGQRAMSIVEQAKAEIAERERPSEPIKHLGMHRHRLPDNREERRLARAWERNGLTDSYQLPWILHCGEGSPPPITQRDATVAATVVQWLGSPVGEGWLARAIGRVGLRRMLRRLDEG